MPREPNASFQQAQFFTDSPALTQILSAAPGNTTARLTALPDPAARVRDAFLTVHQRLPDADESTQATAFLTSRSGDPAAATRDLLWALLTSTEFLTTP